MKSCYDIKRIRDDRLSVAPNQIYDLARSILESTTEFISEYLYCHPELNVTRVHISFENDPVVEDFLDGAGLEETIGLDALCILEDQNADGRALTRDLCRFPTGISRGAYEANRYGVLNKICSAFEAQGYKVLDTESDDIITINLQ